MSKSAIVTARLAPEAIDRLDQLATAMERSRSWLVGKAVERYVHEEGAFLDFVKEGEEAIDRGDFITHEELFESIRSRRRKNAA